MKRMSFLLLVLNVSVANVSFCQLGNQKKTANNEPAKQKASETTLNSTAANTITLPTATTNNEAYGTEPQRFSIFDPTIATLNQRAAGNNFSANRSGILGMPRNAYGFANGKLLLRPTTATSSGTGYGSGSVATGTTIMGIGTGENTPGINGKNPYAGPSLWGIKPPPAQTPAARSAARQ